MCKQKYKGYEYNSSQVLDIWEDIARIARDKYGLTWFEPQFELINEQGMIKNYSQHALPNVYNHWSFGKKFIDYYDDYYKNYEDGRASLAFEVIINSNPAICYMLESNSLATMIDVIAHAAIGHSSFFKNNYLFKEWTNPEAVLPFSTYARQYITECEQKYGIKEVEELITILHSVQNISTDKMKKIDPNKTKGLDKIDHHVFDSLFSKKKPGYTEELLGNFIEYENILEAVLNHADLPEWKQQIVKIFMYMAQYFYPQYQTKVMNEGWASFWEELIVEDMYEEGLIDNAVMMEHLDITCKVCCQQASTRLVKFHDEIVPTTTPSFHTINPYVLGKELFKEIKRVCIEQDEESLQAVPSLRGKEWLEAITFAMENFKDDSFIFQYLTPNLARKMKIAVFELEDHGEKSIFDRDILTCVAAHDDEDFKEVRKELSERHNMIDYTPSIKAHVRITDPGKNRIVPELNIVYSSYKHRLLYSKYMKQTVRYLTSLWKGEVSFFTEKGFLDSRRPD